MAVIYDNYINIRGLRHPRRLYGCGLSAFKLIAVFYDLELIIIAHAAFYDLS